MSVVDRNGISDTYSAIATGKFSEIPLVRGESIGEDFKCRLKGCSMVILVYIDVGNYKGGCCYLSPSLLTVEAITSLIILKLCLGI